MIVLAAKFMASSSVLWLIFFGIALPNLMKEIFWFSICTNGWSESAVGACVNGSV